MKSSNTYLNLILNSVIITCLAAFGGSSSSKPEGIVVDDGFKSLRNKAQQQLAGNIAPAVSIAIY